MNYLAHGWRFADQPYVLAGTAAPDWLSVLDRRSRLRSRTAMLHVEADDPVVAAMARGVVQHHADDAWFHATEAFNTLNLQFAVKLRDALPGDEGFRPSFVGHIAVELLLDAALAEEAPARLAAYYAAIDALEPAQVDRAIQTLATRPVERVEELLRRFAAERFLYDYLDDGKLLTRLNHVMRRVGLPPLPHTIVELFPTMRERVRQRMPALLNPEP